MKRVISLLLALFMLSSLAACGDNDDDKVTEKKQGEIDKYAVSGIVPEFEVKLGTSIDEVKSLFPADYEDADESKVMLSEIEGNTAVCMVTLNASFYYEKAKKDNGVSVVAVTGGNAYGLELGGMTTKSDVTAKLSSEYTEGTATADMQYFLPGVSENCEYLSVKYDAYRLDFFFVDDFLIAVTLTDTANWTD